MRFLFFQAAEGQREEREQHFQSKLSELGTELSDTSAMLEHLRGAFDEVSEEMKWETARDWMRLQQEKDDKDSLLAELRAELVSVTSQAQLPRCRYCP